MSQRANTKLPRQRTVYALSADMVSSRVQRERPDLARRVNAALTSMQHRFPDDLSAGPTLTRGLDEFSAVLNRAERVFDLIVAVNVQMWPTEFRFGVGAGVLDVAGSRGQRDASKMDGPAFHRAASALARSKATEQVVVLEVDGLTPETAALIESAAELHAAILRRLRPGTARVVRAYRAHGTQVATAIRLGVKQSTVSQALSRAEHGDLLRVEKSIREVLRGIDSGP